MLEGLAAIARDLFEGILPLYRDVDFSYALAAAMGAAALLLVLIAVFVHLVRTSATRQFLRDLVGGMSFHGKTRTRTGADDREVQFFSRFVEIDSKLSLDTRTRHPLAVAWRRYRKSLMIGDNAPIRATQKPAEFFYPAMSPPLWLGFAANMFVGFGLLATFLGLVAALTFAASGMSSADVGAMQAALRDLLSAAASKFVTSVAGVGLSIVLRLVERVLVADLSSQMDRICESLEDGIRVDPDSHTAVVATELARLHSTTNGSGTPPNPSLEKTSASEAVTPA